MLGRARVLLLQNDDGHYTDWIKFSSSHKHHALTLEALQDSGSMASRPTLHGVREVHNSCCRRNDPAVRELQIHCAVLLQLLWCAQHQSWKVLLLVAVCHQHVVIGDGTRVVHAVPAAPAKVNEEQALQYSTIRLSGSLESATNSPVFDQGADIIRLQAITNSQAHVQPQGRP